MKDLNIIFMGTPDFSVPALEALHTQYGVKAVVTVPDKPKGRSKKLMPSAVKEKALELDIPVFQPDSLKDEDFLAAMKELKPDIFCVIAFRILPQALYELPEIASFNIHGSLLPKYRGAAPINHAIINGEKITGLTSFVLQKQVDTGDILLTRKVNIKEYETFGDLYNRLKPIAAELAIETVELLKSGDYKPQKQSDTEATAAPKIFREDLQINWKNDSDKLINFIHGVSPVPCAWTLLNGERFKIYRVERAQNCTLQEGEFKIDDNSFIVGTGNGCIKLNEFQFPGKKNIHFTDFIKGWRGVREGRFENE